MKQNKNIISLLQLIDKKEITEKSALQYQYFFQWFVAAIIILLLLESFVSEIKNSTFGNKIIAILTCIIFTCSVQGFSQSQADMVATGNELYNKKEFNKAIEAYNNALEKNPTNFDALHNIGNAQYKNNQIPQALTAYSKAIEYAKTPIQKSAAWYNKGVVLQNNKQLQECIDAYKNALRLNPTDNDARLNLQKAIQLQQKQQQKENNKNEPKKQQPQKQQQQKPQNKPSPTPNKMTKNEAEEKLKALSEKEKNLQDKFNKKEDANSSKLEKDW
jgi:Ca-activated chloride channel homolog